MLPLQKQKENVTSYTKINEIITTDEKLFPTKKICIPKTKKMKTVTENKND